MIIIFPLFRPQNPMSDWEQAARNAVIKTTFQRHKTPRLLVPLYVKNLEKVQKLILSGPSSITLNFWIIYVVCIMALPFLTTRFITININVIDHQYIDLDEATMVNVIIFQKYIQRSWINQISTNDCCQRCNHVPFADPQYNILLFRYLLINNTVNYLSLFNHLYN